ncbi:hypothetical protein [Paralcaligenes ureilyticus]|uniref:Uncharacterized protein n=1 Tax=Paralcaligenes ureilyticus TaxID=627131 RepID=A0A4R3MBN4_9BURK|nr:hypothetical protein [Paralcaligenes ureilyticus]TCT10173.1 hypothetical protein EDC26_102129 [Paralcaligenes ureilyticus]
MKKTSPSSDKKPYPDDHTTAESESDSAVSHHQNKKTPSQKKEDSLDEGLEETFPASDPVSITSLSTVASGPRERRFVKKIRLFVNNPRQIL